MNLSELHQIHRRHLLSLRRSEGTSSIGIFKASSVSPPPSVHLGSFRPGLERLA